MTALLEVAALEAGYGPAQALFGVDLALAEGEAVALMGRNGMGKTTTIRAICGLTPPRRGRVRLGGVEVAGWPAPRIARLGIGLAPEGRRCFVRLTVEENLLAAARPGPWTLERVVALFPRLAERRRQMAGTLSGGEQQMLAIGRALTTNPRLLVLDEATEGLAPLIRAEIWRALADLKQSGLSILVVDKSLDEMRGVVDACVILERGAVAWRGRADEVTPEVAARYLGL